jgi:hypothetical protein
MPLKCTWNLSPNNIIDVCLFGGVCETLKTDDQQQQCKCPPGTIKDNLVFHVESCVPLVVIDLMILAAILYVLFGIRMLFVLKTRKLKQFFRNAVILAFMVCVTGVGCSLSIYIELGARIGWIVFSVPQVICGSALFTNLYLAIVSPLYKSNGRSMDGPEKMSRLAFIAGLVVISINAIVLIIYVDDRESFNIAMMTLLFVGAANLAIIVTMLGSHARQLAEVIQADQQHRENMGVTNNVVLKDVETKVRQIARFSKPMAVNFIFVSMIPALIYLVTSTAPLLWVFTQLTGVLPTYGSCIMVDYLSSKHTRDTTPVDNNNNNNNNTNNNNNRTGTDSVRVIPLSDQ